MLDEKVLKHFKESFLSKSKAQLFEIDDIETVIGKAEVFSVGVWAQTSTGYKCVCVSSYNRWKW